MNKNISGILLRIERIRQEKGQKEICYGICVPSYLCKIERGQVTASEEILMQLYERLGITYTFDEDFITKYQTFIQKYFEQIKYGLDTKETLKKLEQVEKKLTYSPLAIEWLLIQSFEEKENLSLLKEIEECMTATQRAYFYLIESNLENVLSKKLELCKDACELLNNTFSLAYLIDVYMMQGDYTAIHQMENRFVALAVEEGNTYLLAEYFFMKGTAYACLNMEEMMLVYYERGIHLLQNTGWKDKLNHTYYNIGAVYLSLKKYDKALEYLNKISWSDFSINHKKALTLIRSGRKEEAEEFLENMKKCLLTSKENELVERLMYEEALMELDLNFLDKPEYLELLEKLIKALKKEKHFGFLYFYKDVVMEAYCRQRKYKKALEFNNEISSKIINSTI